MPLVFESFLFFLCFLYFQQSDKYYANKLLITYIDDAKIDSWIFVTLVCKMMMSDTKPALGQVLDHDNLLMRDNNFANVINGHHVHHHMTHYHHHPSYPSPAYAASL